MNEFTPDISEGFFGASPTSFSIRVRDTVYLWGSENIKSVADFEKPPVIHMRNAVHGEPLTIETRGGGGAVNDIGILQPGEVLSMEIKGITGINATCDTQTVVYCIIK